MNAVVGDDTGLIKVIRVEDGKGELLAKFGTQGAERGIETLSWAGDGSNGKDTRGREKEVIVSLTNGSIECWDLEEGKIVETYEQKGKVETISGVSVVDRGSRDRGRLLLICQKKGNLIITPFNSEKRKSSRRTTNFRIGSDICVMRLEEVDQTAIATGGNENLLRTWDLETQKASYVSRNVSHDFLDMRVPVWVSEIQYLPGSATRLITGTMHHQCRLYDTKSGQRPIFDIKMGDHAITSIACSNDGSMVYVGDAGGRIQQLDLRGGGKIGSVYKGKIAGAIRSMAVHRKKEVLVSVSLDRHIRSHQISSRKMEAKVYLKQKLTSLLVSASAVLGKGPGKLEDGREDAYDAYEIGKADDVDLEHEENPNKTDKKKRKNDTPSSNSRTTTTSRSTHRSSTSSSSSSSSKPRSTSSSSSKKSSSSSTISRSHKSSHRGSRGSGEDSKESDDLWKELEDRTKTKKEDNEKHSSDDLTSDRYVPRKTLSQDDEEEEGREDSGQLNKKKKKRKKKSRSHSPRSRSRSRSRSHSKSRSRSRSRSKTKKSKKSKSVSRSRSRSSSGGGGSGGSSSGSESDRDSRHKRGGGSKKHKKKR